MSRTIVASEDELRAMMREEFRAVFAEQYGGDTMTSKEAAKLLGCATRSIIYYVKRGYIRSVGAGRNLKFRRSDVLELKARKVPADGV